jgi:hypothetical protein
VKLEAVDAIMVRLDFRALCAINQTLYEEEYKGAPAVLERAREIFKRCNEVNDVRNRIAHAHWRFTEAGMSAAHLSRRRTRWATHFLSSDELKREIAKIDAVDAELRALLSGDYDPPDDDGPSDDELKRDIAELAKADAELRAANAELRALLSGDYDPPDDDRDNEQ